MIFINSYPYTNRGFVAFFALFVSILSEVKAQTHQDALKYDINIDAKGVFNSGIQANTKIFLKKLNADSVIRFDLLGLAIDSVFLNESLTTFQKTDTTVLVKVPFSTNIGDSLTVDIFYRGIPQKDALWGGFYVSGTYAFNMGVGFQSKPHNFGRAWFPCFDNFTDRALYTLEVTTAPTYTAVCGGLLVDDTTYIDGSSKWTWELHQPIPTYLAGMAIGKYTFVKHTFTGQFGSLPVWLAVEPKDTAKLNASFVKLNNAISCFEERFGPYLFDRVGFVCVPFNAGAMEHAANIAYPLYAIDGTLNYETLMAHELSHHWWGNLTTCETAEEMWMNEGWASFCEALFLECVYGTSNYQNDMREKLTEVLLSAPANDKGYKAVSGVPHEQTYGTTVYKKGALMANALRTIMGDSAFFAACKSYLDKYKFNHANSQNLRDEFQRFTPTDLTFFFNQYIFQKGHFDVVVFSSSKSGSNLTLQLMELSRYKTAKHSNMTVSVTLHFTDQSTQKTNATLTNGEGVVTVNIPLGKTINYVTIDDETKYALGYTSQSAVIKTKGTFNFSDALLNINTQNITDSVLINVQHHWVGPSVGALRNQGIRISNERYWSVRGQFPASFSAWAYFNYNGTSQNFLDEELFNIATTEDSLVLLYRANENSEWNVIHVPTDATYQPGGNPKDKLGRFWLTKLLPGDYAFGVRDQSVVGLKSNQKETGLNLAPNPVDDVLTITLPDSENFLNAVVLITDNKGFEVIKISVNNNQNKHLVNIKKLTPGIYYLVIENGKKRYTARFIKS
jgi:aminopeptidase N